MKPELQEKLIEKYPKIFSEVGMPPDKSCMAWGLCVGDGWYWLIDQLCELLQYGTDKNGKHQVVAAQVKEKFGGLRFYINSGDDEQYAMIHLAENMSYSICEECGSLDDVKQTTGWIKSLCPVCRKQLNKRTKEDRDKIKEEE